MEQYGNASYNVESVLRKNIVDSEYFRDTCGKLGSWSEVVDQIYYDVTSVEPWMSGNARGASTAFCLLYRSVSLHHTPARGVRALCLACRVQGLRKLAVRAQAVHPADLGAGGQGPDHPHGLALHPSGAPRLCSWPELGLRPAWAEPCVRASQVGFLYIRYVANPRTIWQWIQPYVRDEEVSS